MIRALGLAAVLCLVMVLPYLPGRFDASSAALSLAAQVGTFLSLVLVPVGVAWMVARRRARLWGRLAWGWSAVIALAVILACASANQLALGVVLGLGSLMLLRAAYRRSRSDLDRAAHQTAIYLVFVPVILLAFRVTVLTRAADWSRDRAIQHAAALITEIEGFRQRHGRYPVSLQSLNPDVPTGVIGIERFLYEPNGDAYNLFFVRPHIELDAREVVMFNPRDEHRFTSHELDILQYDGERLDLRRGDRRRTPLPQPHWISILFD